MQKRVKRAHTFRKIRNLVREKNPSKQIIDFVMCKNVLGPSERERDAIALLACR